MSEAPAVWAVVLAAGASRRFGSSKQLALYRGRPLVERAAAQAASVCGERTLLLAGSAAGDVVAAAGGHCRFFAVNDNYADGIGSSIALAAGVLRAVADALLLVFADQPLVPDEHLAALPAGWSGDADHIVASGYANSCGPPLLLPAGCFEDLTNLSGDRGARALLGDSRFRLTTIDCAAAALDVDTVADLERLP